MMLLQWLALCLLQAVGPSSARGYGPGLVPGHSMSLQRFRGGALQPPPSLRRTLSGVSAVPQATHTSQAKGASAAQNRTVMVTVSAGSPFLERRQLVRIGGDVSVGDLKQALSRQFPGYPPRPLQKLYLGPRLLADEESLAGLPALAPLPLTLDLLCGTGAYNRSVQSVAASLEALSAVEVHIAANAMLQAELVASGDGVGAEAGGGGGDLASFANASQQRLALYRDLFRAQNSSLYRTFSDGIAAALRAEKNPEKDSPDTAAWRGLAEQSGQDRGRGRGGGWSLTEELNLSAEDLRSGVGTSLLLSVSESRPYHC
jgi:hypothetical protein